MADYNLDYIWDTIIYPQVDKLQKIYKIKKKGYVIIHIVLLAIMIILACTETYLLKEMPALIPAMVLPNMILFCFDAKTSLLHCKELKKFYNVFFEGHNITHSWKSSDYFTETDILSSNLFNATHMSLDDIFTGTYKNIPFQLAEVDLIQASGKHSILKFSGSILVINNFFETNEIVIYPKTYYKNKQNYNEEMSSFFKKLSAIGGFRGTIITPDQIFIFRSNPFNDYELSNYENITKEQFEQVVNAVFEKLQLLDTLNIQEEYRFPQTTLNKSMTYDQDIKRGKKSLAVCITAILAFDAILISSILNTINKPDQTFTVILSVLFMAGVVPLIFISRILYKYKYRRRRR